MGLLDLVLGRKRDMEPAPVVGGASREDAHAVDRYERMLRTAPHDVIENVHIQAFERLTPGQLDLLFERFTAHAPSPEQRPADARPATLARAATEAETREPGALARMYMTERNGLAPSAWAGASILDTVAWYAIASVAFSSWTPSANDDDAAASAASSNDRGQDATGAPADAFDGFWDFDF